MTIHDQRLSRLLSRVLRHQATELGLVIDEGGWVQLSQLLALPLFQSYNTADVTNVVEHNDKQRFSFRRHSDGRYFIRANQGHSIVGIRSSELLTPIDSQQALPLVCLHGTNKRSWEKIRLSGYLSRMKRNHVHFACGFPKWIPYLQKRTIMERLNLTAEEKVPLAKSGMRRSANILIFLDLKKIIHSADILKLYRSDNNVILCEGNKDGRIGKEYFQLVYDIEKDCEIKISS